MTNLARLPRDIDRYMLLSGLQERNERIFYRTVMDHIETLLPLIYTPTVGEACREFSHLARDPKGFFITPDDRGEIERILGNWPEKDIRVIVVTDGQRILGLGDLGANGMGIPIGKLALYTACAGIPPHQCLPVTLDVGTNNEELLADELYLGYPKRRLAGKAYFDLVEEFVTAVQKRYPDALIQFEDFLTPNAYALLRKYRDRVLCFNDDIQGTAAVALAGVYASTRITKVPFSELRIMFLGAGSAATGIADLVVTALVDEGLSLEEARRHLWFVDMHGLVVKSRTDLMEHNLPYAHDHAPLDFLAGDRRPPAARADRRHRRAGDVHPRRRREDERAQRASGDLRPVESHFQSRVHRGAGIRMESGTRGVHERQPVRQGDLPRQGAAPRAGEQRLRLSRVSAWAPWPAGRGASPTSSSWRRPAPSPGWSVRRSSTRPASIRPCRRSAGSRSPSRSRSPRRRTR